MPALLTNSIRRRDLTKLREVGGMTGTHKHEAGAKGISNKMSVILLVSNIAVAGREGRGEAEGESRGIAEVESKDPLSTPVAPTTPKKDP